MLTIIKVGSRVLTKENGLLNKTVAKKLVKEIAKLKKAGHKVVLITSGAVSLGKSIKNLTSFKVSAEHINYGKEIVKEQILAAIGQPKLIAFYTEELERYGITCAQILATRSDFGDRNKYISLRTVTSNLLALDVLPIFNENDVFSPEELDFSDNDQLALMVAAMLVADNLILLTNVDGVYNGSPKNHSSKLIPVIQDAKKFLRRVDDSAQTGKGGMRSKLLAADTAMSLGITMHIANGLKLDGESLSQLIEGKKDIGTSFPAHRNDKKGKARKGWILSAATFGDKKIIVSTFISDLLRQKKFTSILFSGIERVEGDFDGTENNGRGEVVEICDENSIVLAKGIPKYSSTTIRELLEDYKAKPLEVRKHIPEAVHYDLIVFIS